MSLPPAQPTSRAEGTPKALVQRDLDNTVQEGTPTRLQMILIKANPQNQPPACKEMVLTCINSKVLGMSKSSGLNTHHCSTSSLLNCIFSWLCPITASERKAHHLYNLFHGMKSEGRADWKSPGCNSFHKHSSTQPTGVYQRDD